MDFKKTEEQELLLESLRTVMERGNFEDYFKECDKNHEYPQKAVDALVEAGFSTLGIPEEHGGTPTDILTQIMVAEEAMRSAIRPCAGSTSPPRWTTS